MNRFTQFLRQWLDDDREFGSLIEHLDALEALVIRVYKGQSATAADEAEYVKLRHWLQGNYPAWQDEVRPHWQEALVAGHPAAEDPIERLLQAGAAADFVGDWEAMQQLPAMREALNRLVLSRSSKE
jgi:hypothetical protein